MSINRRCFIKKAATGVVAASLPLRGFSVEPSKSKLVILHTNDLHSQIEPIEQSATKYRGRGGFSALAALIKRVRLEQENVLLVDCGDFSQGTPYFNFFKGEVEVKLMNALKYDFVTLGNHEFDNGTDSLYNALQKAKFGVVVSNFEIEDTRWQNIIKPYFIKAVGNIKVGILGLSVDPIGLTDEANFNGLKYLDYIEAGNRVARFLKVDKKCDVVVAITHLGLVSDRILAKKSEHINLILGGHSHSLLKEPEHVNNSVGKQVLINQVGSKGVYLGRIDLFFDSDNHPSGANILV